MIDLECSRDATHRFDANTLANLCPQEQAPLLVRYGQPALDRATVAGRPFTLWRYREMLPPTDDPVTLGEGGTPLLALSRLSSELGLRLLVKDESGNPTGSFKARGMTVAVTAARDRGARALVAPSAGNAGVALAAYGARAGLAVRVYLPRDTPALIVESTASYDAEVRLVDGLIDDAGKLAAADAAESGAFNVATLREPYRVEGKKTMAYELIEQLGAIPGTIVYPTGGGTGLIGMWKAFDELEALGWIGAERPVMISVQAAGCAPIVDAFDRGEDHAVRAQDAHTAAWGLRVPAALGDRLMLAALRASRGAAIAVSEEAMHAGMHDLRAREGIDAAEEGGAVLAGVRALRERGFALPEPVVLFNTGSWLPYGSRV